MIPFNIKVGRLGFDYRKGFNFELKTNSFAENTKGI